MHRKRSRGRFTDAMTSAVVAGLIGTLGGGYCYYENRMERLESNMAKQQARLWKVRGRLEERLNGLVRLRKHEPGAGRAGVTYRYCDDHPNREQGWFRAMWVEMGMAPWQADLAVQRIAILGKRDYAGECPADSLGCYDAGDGSIYSLWQACAARIATIAHEGGHRFSYNGAAGERESSMVSAFSEAEGQLAALRVGQLMVQQEWTVVGQRLGFDVLMDEWENIEKPWEWMRHLPEPRSFLQIPYMYMLVESKLNSKEAEVLETQRPYRMAAIVIALLAPEYGFDIGRLHDHVRRQSAFGLKTEVEGVVTQIVTRGQSVWKAISDNMKGLRHRIEDIRPAGDADPVLTSSRFAMGMRYLISESNWTVIEDPEAPGRVFYGYNQGLIAFLRLEGGNIESLELYSQARGDGNGADITFRKAEGSFEVVLRPNTRMIKFKIDGIGHWPKGEYIGPVPTPEEDKGSAIERSVIVIPSEDRFSNDEMLTIAHRFLQEAETGEGRVK